ncbi:MAG: ABC transporter permease [Gemmataceae bacterium]|nr:ABC transporter permease [Gemmataceae bacterium]
MNPIIRRELLDLLRTRKALAAEFGLAAAAALLVLVRWPTGGVGDLNGTAALQVLRVYGYGLLACLLLVLPAFPATAIVRERVRGTLALLLNSPMSPTRIYLGKLGGALGFTALLLLMTVQGAAACYALGGSTMSGGVGLLYAVLGAAAVQVAALGLYVSSRAQTTDGALRATYAAVLGVTFVPLAAHYLIPRDNAILDIVASWFGALSPVPAAMEVVGHGGLGIPGSDYGSGAVLRYLIVAGLTSLLLAVMTVRKLARAPLDVARAAGVMTDDRSRGERAARRVLYLVDPKRRTRGIGRWVNPVMVKEFRSRKFGRADWTLRLVALTAILSLALSVVAAGGALGWGVEVIGGALVILQAALLILFAPSLAAGLVSAERESGTWTLLRTTPLTPGRIVRGKLMSVAWPVLLLLVATFPGYVVMTTLKPETAHQVERVLICLGVTAAFAVLVGAAASSVFRTTAAATAAAYLVLAAVCVGPLLVWLGRDAPFGHRTVEAALTIDPVAAALRAADTPGFTQYDLLPANWWVIGSACVVLLGVLAVRVRQLYRPE